MRSLESQGALREHSGEKLEKAAKDWVQEKTNLEKAGGVLYEYAESALECGLSFDDGFSCRRSLGRDPGGGGGVVREVSQGARLKGRQFGD